jgi:hypothetical protein
VGLAMMRRDPYQLPADRGRLPADLGARAATRFYLHRLAILAALIGLAALVPAVVVLVGRGSGVPTRIVVVVLLGLGVLYVVESGIWSSGGGGVFALSAISLRFAPEDEEPDHRQWRWFDPLLRLIPGARLVRMALEFLRRLNHRR